MKVELVDAQVSPNPIGQSSRVGLQQGPSQAVDIQPVIIVKGPIVKGPIVKGPIVKARTVRLGRPNTQPKEVGSKLEGHTAEEDKGGMTENITPKAGVGGSANSGDATAGESDVKQLQTHLRKLFAKSNDVRKNLEALEKTIAQKEREYLENTPSGNLITGFDMYTRATTGAAAQRRRTGLTDANRVFSRSSISYNANADVQTPGSSLSTPASHAPTPLSISSAANNQDGVSGAPTPTSATATSKKKNNKRAALVAGGEDSETDSRETKKVRTSFGAVRK